MDAQHSDTESREGKEALDRRLEQIGWGLLLLFIGALWLLPDDQVPAGAWWLGFGFILLGLNAVRYARGIRISGLGTALGVLALLGGLGSIAGVQVPLFAVFLLLVGASMVVKPLVHKER